MKEIGYKIVNSKIVGGVYINRDGKKVIKKIKKYCPNCKKEWDGIECNNCGFDVSEVDIC